MDLIDEYGLWAKQVMFTWFKDSQHWIVKICCNYILNMDIEAERIFCLIFKISIFPRGGFFEFSLWQLFCDFQAHNILASNWHIIPLHLLVRLCASLTLASKLHCLHKPSVNIHDPIQLFECSVFNYQKDINFLIPSCRWYLCIWIHVNWCEEIECHLFSTHPSIQLQKLIFYNIQIV